MSSLISTEEGRRALQRALLAHGFDVGPDGADGLLGGATARAIIAARIAFGLADQDKAEVDTNLERELGLLAIQSPAVVAAARTQGLDLLSLIGLIGPISNLLKGKTMTADQITGVLRAVLTTAGGYFVTKGWLSSDTLGEIIGAVLTLGGAAWSIYSNRPKTIVPLSAK